MKNTDDGLVVRATVCELIRTFAEARDVVRVAYGMLTTAQKSLDDRFKLGGHSGVSIYLESYGHRSADFLDVEFAIVEMEKQAWRSVVDRLDIWRVMSEARAAELRKHIEDGTLPPLTEEAAMQLAAAYIGNLDKLIDELTVEVFDWLRPRVDEEGRTFNGGRYKTNRRDIVGAKVVRPLMIDRQIFDNEKFQVRYGECQQRLRSLENLFRILDGKGVCSDYYSDLERAIEASPDGKGQTDYFGFRACKNRSLHLEFLRTDLLSEFNRRAGGKNFK